MKDCEIFSALKVPCGSKIVIRADGRSFSHMARKLKFEKPYDSDFEDLMVRTCGEFYKEFSPSFIYTFSDEINILMDEIPFSGRIEKLNSIFASFLTSEFTREIYRHERFSNILLESKLKPISFDSRIIPLNSDSLVTYFKGRQDESWRNCLNGYAYWSLREEYGKREAAQILDKKKNREIHDILFKNNVNISQVPCWHRRGVGIYRQKFMVSGYNPVKNEKVKSLRWKPIINWDLPIFDEEFFYSNEIIKQTTK